MASELRAKGREQFLREGVILARSKPHVQRSGQHVGWDVLLDRRGHGPAALAGVLDVADETVERGVFVERDGGEVEQP